MYNVKVEQFEGPLDLLLDLITKEKLDITEISLAQVTDQYLSYLDNVNETELPNMAEFLSIASQLILLKSKSLLPLLVFDDEETDEEEVDLIERVVEYKKFKEISERIGEMLNGSSKSYSGKNRFEKTVKFRPPKNIDGNEIKKLYENVLSEIPVAQKLDKKSVEKIVSLKEKINFLRNILQKKKQISFNDLIEKKKDSAEVVISFLAVLEMVKRRALEVEQAGVFREIKLKVKND